MESRKIQTPNQWSEQIFVNRLKRALDDVELEVYEIKFW